MFTIYGDIVLEDIAAALSLGRASLCPELFMLSVPAAFPPADALDISVTRLVVAMFSPTSPAKIHAMYLLSMFQRDLVENPWTARNQ